MILNHAYSYDEPQSRGGVNTLDTIVDYMGETKVGQHQRWQVFHKSIFWDIGVNIKVSVEWRVSEYVVSPSPLQT